MNIENINKLISTFKHLHRAPLAEYPDKGFTMRTPDFNDGEIDYSEHNCGTASCILGWYKLLKLEIYRTGVLDDEPEWHVALTCPARSNGCSYDYRLRPEKFTLPAAIRVLEILRDTGEVNWNEAIANPWKPEDDAPAKPLFNADDWMQGLINTDGVAGDILLIEGPVRTPISPEQSEAHKAIAKAKDIGG